MEFIFLVLFLVMISFFYEVFEKRRLIKALAIQLSMEMTRVEHLEVEDRTAKIHTVMNDFLVNGGKEVAAKKTTVISENTSGVLYKAATDVSEFRKTKYADFLYQVQTLRWVLDAFDAIIGENKSTEVAWVCSLRYMEQYYTELCRKEKVKLPWLQTLPKLMGLPQNVSDPKFVSKIVKANYRKRPKGWITLWFASRLFDYISDLRYGVMIKKDRNLKWVEKTGLEAWRIMQTYKAWHHHRTDLITS